MLQTSVITIIGMTNPFDADDLLKRSIFSSILGFGRKVKNTGRVGSVKDEDVSGPAVTINNNGAILDELTACKRKYRTEQEIYNEIVCECAELEKNKAASMPNSAQMRSVACSTSELMDMTINPDSLDPHFPTEHSNNITVQNLVRLLVVAVKESGILNDQCGTNSSEDILKRKRLQEWCNSQAKEIADILVKVQNKKAYRVKERIFNTQNKKAAIRYRKRQKELKEEAELELTILVNKNNELKNEIKRMQAEIDQLKARVLQRTSEEA
uniref:BZIP domain-containing protein n=1 Tax=Setaria digitata TaxID=48799 RepID=A0A915PYE0_9BILA